MSQTLSKTETEKSRVIYQAGVPLVEIGAGARIVMTGTRVNGVLQDDICVDSDGEITIKPVSGQTLVTEKTRIHFQGKQIEVAPFLERCHKNLSKFADDLQTILNKMQ